MFFIQTKLLVLNLTSSLFSVCHLCHDRQGGGPRAPLLRRRKQLSQLWQRPGAARWRGRGVEGLACHVNQQWISHINQEKVDESQPLVDSSQYS